jgi:phosphoenolpyruvate carboxylase
VNLPGWFGLGTSLREIAAEPGGRELLRALHDELPFFRSVLETAELALAKADPAIAREYLAMGERPELARAILEEYERSVEGVLSTTGAPRLLAARPILRRTVDLRNPAVDALSFLQMRYLRALRSGDPAEREAAAGHVLVTLNGIAAGLQDTG